MRRALAVLPVVRSNRVCASYLCYMTEQKETKINAMRYKDKAGIVTGGASGIGEATVKEFAREGALVAIFDINKAAGEKLAADCQKLGQKVHFYVCDVSDKNAVVKTVDEFAKLAGGKLHFLINNAVYFGSKALDAEKADWDKSFGVNVVGYANMVQAAHKYLKAAGKSAVVNNASISAHIAQPNRWTYAATKGAVTQLTRCMALDLSIDGIRVNSVSPAWVWSPEVMKAAADGGREKWDPIWGKFHMLRRCAECSEVATVFLFLCCDESSFITATDIPVDGGYMSMSAEGLGEFSNFAGTKESAKESKSA